MGSRFLKANAAVAVAVLQDPRQTAAGAAGQAAGAVGRSVPWGLVLTNNRCSQ